MAPSKRTIVFFACLAMSLSASPASAGSNPYCEDGGPYISAQSISPDVVDTTSSSAEVTAMIVAGYDGYSLECGLVDFGFKLTGPSGQKISPHARTFVNNHTYRFLTTLPTGSEQGVWSITDLFAVDSEDHEVYYATTGLSFSNTDTTPTGLAAIAGYQSAVVSFSPPKNDRGSPITSYTIRSSPGGLTATGASSPIRVTGLTTGTPYTFTAIATNALGDSVPSNASAPIIPPPSSFSVNDISIAEGNSGTTAGTFVITRSGFVAEPASVKFSTANGMASSPGDYLPLSLTSLEFPAGETYRTVGVEVKGDKAAEQTETFFLRLSAAFGASLSDPTGTASIVNDDFPPTDVSAVPGFRSATVSFNVPGGTGVEPMDFYTVNSSPGGLTATGPGSPITISGLSTGVAYTFTVVGTNAAGTGSPSAPSNSVTPPPSYFSVTDVTTPEGNSGTTHPARFTISRGGYNGAPATVKYSTVGGTAQVGSDFSPLPLTSLDFPAGVTSKVVDVAITGDTASELNETFSLKLSEASGASISDPSGTATITNDDIPVITVSDPIVVEGTGSGTTTARFVVSRTAAAGTSTVKVVSTNGTARAPSDYTSLAPTTISFGPGETAKTVDVLVNRDSVIEPDETFLLVLSEPTGATLGESSATATITDDDTSLSIDDQAIAEGDVDWSVLSFVITRSGKTNGSSTVSFATSDGGAKAPQDYVSRALTAVTFGPGEITKIVNVTIRGDTSAEPNETFYVKLSAASGATIADSTGTGTIMNDD